MTEKIKSSVNINTTSNYLLFPQIFTSIEPITCGTPSSLLLDFTFKTITEPLRKCFMLNLFVFGRFVSVLYMHECDRLHTGLKPYKIRPVLCLRFRNSQ